MRRELAVALCGLAHRLLPARRRPWGEAMAAELVCAEDDAAALSFAGGCLVTAIDQRIRDFDTRFSAGLWGIALTTVALAAVRIAIALHGVQVLFGARDGMLAALVRGGADAALIASYERARPLVIAGFFALGIVQCATAWFLAGADLGRFAIAWGVALLIAVVVVAIQLAVVRTPIGLPSEFHALIVQGVALPALLLWSHGRHRREESRL